MREGASFRMKNPRDRVTLQAIVPQADPTTHLLENRLASDIALTAVAHQVLFAILQSPKQDNWHFITPGEMLNTTKRSKNAIRVALLQLEERGYIVIGRKREPGMLREKHRYLVVGDEGAYDER